MKTNINFKALKKKMNKNVIIILVGLILISGAVIADLTNIIPKDETLKLNLSPEVKTFANQNYRNIYWNDKVTVNGNATLGYLHYEVLEGDVWEKREGSIFLYDKNNIGTTPEETLLKQKMTDSVEGIIKRRYEKSIVKPSTMVSVGTKTISLD